MHCARLVPQSLLSRPSKLPIALLVAMALFGGPRMGGASPISSRILIDPVGEHTGDFFGTSVAWIGDVNGDGYDDVLVGAFRYPEIQSYGKAYLYFGGPALDSVADLVIPPPAGNTAWFGVSVASAGGVHGGGPAGFLSRARPSRREGTGL